MHLVSSIDTNSELNNTDWINTLTCVSLTPTCVFTECILEKLHRCAFFDDDVSRSIFYPSLHDATLTILDAQKVVHEQGPVVRKEPLDPHGRLV